MTFPALLLRLNALGATGFSGVLVSLPEPPHAQTITLVSAYKSVIATLRACINLGELHRLMPEWVGLGVKGRGLIRCPRYRLIREIIPWILGCGQVAPWRCATTLADGLVRSSFAGLAAGKMGKIGLEMVAKSSAVAILFIATAVAEILGCYLPWLVLKQGKSGWLLVPAAGSLALFVWLLTLHPSAAGRTYAAYGGVYIGVALIWLRLVDGVALTRWDWIGAALGLAGMATIALQPGSAQ